MSTESDGMIVEARYKTGVYIGRIAAQKNDKALIEVAAVLKHPRQGDLHHPFESDVPFFHERKALAEREKVWVPAHVVKKWCEDVPTYDESLRQAWQREVEAMNERGDEWAKKALACLNNLAADYGFRDV